jgi:tyrosyl-tRNA synthetase
MQVGGSDQWGNITSGIEFVKKKLKKEAYGITIPLLTTETGQKFGKSEGNALWMRPDQTDDLLTIHQYLINFPDDQVSDLLRKFTFFP